LSSSSGEIPKYGIRAYQKALCSLETWCDEVRLLVSSDKTGLIVFTRKGRLPGFSATHFFGVTLHYSVSVKYFGVILDSRLTKREYVDVKVRKAQNVLWDCRRACGVTWGLRP
jgi:hypothetical protein